MSIFADRRARLAAFLNELPEEKFNINNWVSDCDTNACAAGWCPVVFPGEWKLDGCGFARVPVLCDRTKPVDPTIWANYLAIQDLKRFFDLTGEEETYIFHNEGYLTDDVSPKQVAARLLEVR